MTYKASHAMPSVLIWIPPGSQAWDKDMGTESLDSRGKREWDRKGERANKGLIGELVTDGVSL